VSSENTSNEQYRGEDENAGASRRDRSVAVSMASRHAPQNGNSWGLARGLDSTLATTFVRCAYAHLYANEIADLEADGLDLECLCQRHLHLVP
jgi:hypothetical protein